MSLIQTYTFWQLVDRYAVVIPIVQRDYAQGRKDSDSQEIREKFIDDILICLSSNKPLELDFVFGKVDNDTFIPIDGQQRLTTLFLIHWYFAIKSGNELIREEFKKVRFSYKTRISSKDFTDCLIRSTIEFDETNKDFRTHLKKIKDLKPGDEPRHYLSFCIRNSSWFFRKWQKDPTVQSMLVMLDSIHYKLRGLSSPVDYWTRLTAPNHALPANNLVLHELVRNLEMQPQTLSGEVNDLLRKLRSAPLISFKLLNLEDFQLTDELYLKMNARGRPLNNLENFKAWLIGYVSERKIEVPDAGWPTKFDKSWTDLFWKHRDDDYKIDTHFMRFINGMLMFGLAIKGDREQILFFFNEQKIQLSKYEALQSFSSEEMELIGRTLDWLYLYDHPRLTSQWLSGVLHWQESPYFKDFISEKNTYANRVLFYATVIYIRYHPDDADPEPKEFSRWIRVVRNLVAQSTIDSAETFIEAIRSLNDVGIGSQSILTYLARPDSKLQGFLSLQVAEERVKAVLILENSHWEAELEEIENYGLFHGSIGFLLLNADQGNFDLFIQRRTIARLLFANDGASQVYKNDYLLIRMALAVSQVDENIRLKDNGQNWRNLLKVPKIQIALLQIMDDLQIIPEPEFTDYFCSQIDAYNDQTVLWRYHLVKNKILLSGKAKGINISDSNFIQQKYDQQLYYLFKNEGGNWINNDNQILLSNLRNEIIMQLLSTDPMIRADQNDSWWVFTDTETKQTFYRGLHIWLSKNTGSGLFKFRYQFMPQDVIVGIHNDHEGPVMVAENPYEKHNSWKISGRLSFNTLKTTEEIREFINQLLTLVRKIENYLS